MLPFEFQEGRAAELLQTSDYADASRSGAVKQLAIHEIRLKIGALFQRRALLGRHANVTPGQSLRLRDGIDSSQLEDELVPVPPDLFNGVGSALNENPPQIVEPARAVAERFRREFAPVSTGAQQMRDDDRFQRIIPGFRE